jgi:hypothetical protein
MWFARISAVRLSAATAALLLSGGSPGAEPERCLPAVASYADVLERVAPAIVSVYTKSAPDLYRASLRHDRAARRTNCVRLDPASSWTPSD